MTDVIRNWERKREGSFFKSIREKVLKDPPLREKLSQTIFKLKVQNEKLDQSVSWMQNNYDTLFSKCIGAVASKNQAQAIVYANECAEIKKIVSIILRSQFAIEQVMLRLETVEDFGNIVCETEPLTSVITSIRGQLSGVIPEASYKLGEIGDSLNDLIIGVDVSTGAGRNLEASEEASKILEEAATVAEQKVKERFPSLPEVTAYSIKGGSESKVQG